MRATQTGDLWWKTAVFYCLDVQTFYDSDGDGIGDFAGLAERLDHLVELGVTVIWLMPFYPTADVDDGYDITDYYTVDPRLGTLGDFVEFMRSANSRGLRVIADLVVNHTSAKHPWFQSARASADSPTGTGTSGATSPARKSRATWSSRIGRPASGPRTGRPASITCTGSTAVSPT